eukprot:TRINITY_DN51939_c0_g1_i1.p1 TRINITY_DN51939_c0_g1~~TRINITY_DN51939_c0_g1_i1.p1  ORF type:complete len:753 (-),score=126.30 TRINITY_DN51939_c0_g1_i1:64-2292(-)
MSSTSDSESSSDSGSPLKRQRGGRRTTAAKKKTITWSSSSSSASSEAPKKKKAKGKNIAATPKKKEVKKKGKPTPKSSPKPKSAAALAREAKKKALLAEEAECQWEWWKKPAEHPNGAKWLTLEHNGVMFPDEYTPHGRPIIYDGKQYKLEPDEEEVATMFAVMRESVIPPNDYYVNPVFRRNFMHDWLQILNSDPDRNMKRYGTKKHPIARLELCNFDTIWDWFSKERERKKAMTTAEKARVKEERDKKEARYKYCYWDSRKQPVGNFRIEPPGLFRGRGAHPRMGFLKQRIQPEDVTINIGKDAKVPDPPEGHNWKEVRHDTKASWLAMWRDTVNGSFKYVMLGANSMVKGKSDWKKFQKAKRLGSLIETIRGQYRKEWYDQSVAVRQRAVAMYFIDKLALRCGNEKGEDEAETFGTCSLKVEHISFNPNNKLGFDFLGKDSIRYQNETEVDPKVYSLCKEFTKGKTGHSDLFDLLQPAKLNEHLKTFMEGLSAKVFRTYNASKCLDDYVHDNPVDEDLTAQEKLAYFTEANTQVAILCNHQKSVGKGHLKAMKTFDDKMDGLEEDIKMMEKCAKVAKGSGGYAKAKKMWEEWEEEKQSTWVEKYGTAEEKANWAKDHKAKPKKKATQKIKLSRQDQSSSSSEDEPPARKKPARRATAKKAVKEETSSSSSSDSDAPIKKRKAQKKKKVETSSSSESDTPVQKKAKKEPKSEVKDEVKDEAESPNVQPATKKAKGESDSE